jgi:hypothetical protein
MGSDVSNETCHDFSLYVVLKQFPQIKKLGWRLTAPQEEGREDACLGGHPLRESQSGFWGT